MGLFFFCPNIVVYATFYKIYINFKIILPNHRKLCYHRKCNKEKGGQPLLANQGEIRQRNVEVHDERWTQVGEMAAHMQITKKEVLDRAIESFYKLFVLSQNR